LDISSWPAAAPQGIRLQQSIKSFWTSTTESETYLAYFKRDAGALEKDAAAVFTLKFNGFSDSCVVMFQHFGRITIRTVAFPRNSTL